VRFLADENIPGDAVVVLRELGHDVEWAHEIMPGASDVEVLDHAQADARIVLTFDKDFGALVFRHRLPAAQGVLLFRIAIPSPAHAVHAICTAIETRTDWQGHFAVVHDDRIRLVRLPSVAPDTG